MHSVIVLGALQRVMFSSERLTFIERKEHESVMIDHTPSG